MSSWAVVAAMENPLFSPLLEVEVDRDVPSAVPREDRKEDSPGVPPKNGATKGKFVVCSKQLFPDIPRLMRNPTLAVSSCYA